MSNLNNITEGQAEVRPVHLSRPAPGIIAALFCGYLKTTGTASAAARPSHSITQAEAVSFYVNSRKE